MTIELHTWNTPNGRKISVALEEMGLPYSVHTVNIGKGEQFKPEFLKISPNNRIPAIIDREGPGGQPISVAVIVLLVASVCGTSTPRPHASSSQSPRFFVRPAARRRSALATITAG